MFDPGLGSEKDTGQVKAWALPLRKLVRLLVSGDNALSEGGHSPRTVDPWEKTDKMKGPLLQWGRR